MTVRLRRGFTLLELLVSVVCLTASSAGVLAALQYAGDKTTYSKERALALQVALSQADSAKSDAFNGLLSAGSSVTVVATPGVPGGVTITKTVTEQGTTALYATTIQAQWNYKGATQTLTLDTILWLGNVT